MATILFPKKKNNAKLGVLLVLSLFNQFNNCFVSGVLFNYLQYSLSTQIVALRPVRGCRFGDIIWTLIACSC